MQVALELDGLCKSYGDVQVVRDISLRIRKGELISLLGPSGCGKSTTLRMIAGFEQPDSGRILVDGNDITDLAAHRRNLGMVFQNYGLFPHMTVNDNVAYGLKRRGVAARERAERVAEALKLVRLPDMGGRYPAQLSGGQQQRVALARALIIEPSLLLLDEPLSSLDAKLRVEMRDEIKELQAKTSITTVFVTHDQDEALSLSDRIVVMSAGRIEQIDRPDIVYSRPATPFVADFMGEANLVEGTVALARGKAHLVHASGVRLPVAAEGLENGQRARISIRPEAISVSPGKPKRGVDGLEAQISGVTYRGAFSMLTCRLSPTLELRAAHTNRGGDEAPLALGDTVHLEWSPLAARKV
ncbi:MAG: ABC transporter ATP-binding protein [Flavobacteriaceae bacterium]